MKKLTFIKVVLAINKWTSSSNGLLFAALSIVIGLGVGTLLKFNDTYTLIFNLFLSIVTYLICFILQTSQARDTKTLGLKIDYLIKESEADNILIKLEEEEQDKIDELDAELKQFKSDN